MHFSFLFFFFPGDQGNASSILGREPMGTGETITASNDAFNVHLGMLSESRHGEKCQPLHTHLVQFDSFLCLAGAKTWPKIPKNINRLEGYSRDVGPSINQMKKNGGFRDILTTKHHPLSFH